MARLKHWLCPVTLLGVVVSHSLLLQGADAPHLGDTSDRTNLLVYRDDEGRAQPVRAAGDWRKRRAQILAAMQEVMGPLPETDRRTPLEVRLLEEVDEGPFIRRKLTYLAEQGDRVPAYLLIPKHPHRMPAVLCLHQTTKIGKSEPAGLGPKSDLQYAKHLAERGYVTLAPDYPNFGEYEFDPYAHGYQSATMKGIWNHMRAVDLLQSLPEVDPERIGVIGHSLGGHNSMFVAAFDERIKGVVSNCGFCSFPTYAPPYIKGAPLAGWSHKGYMPRLRTAYQLKAERIPFDFPEVVAVLAPRAFLASAPVGDTNFAVDGVKDCIRLAQPVYDLLDAGQKLSANYPDCGHSFPADVRKVAYEWLDRWLMPN